MTGRHAGAVRKQESRIKDQVLSCPDVRDLHDLRPRYSGDRTFVEFHLEVDGHLTIAEGRTISDAVEVAVDQLFLPSYRRSDCPSGTRRYQ